MMQGNLQDQELLLWDRGEWDHPPFPVLEAYVNEALGEVDQEIIEGHFAVCEHCVAEARLLRVERLALASDAPSTAPPGKSRPRLLMGLVGVGLGATALWFAFVQPLLGARPHEISPPETSQATPSPEQTTLQQQVRELEAGRKNVSELSVKQSAELTALRLKIQRLEKEKADRAKAIPPATPSVAPTSLPTPRASVKVIPTVAPKPTPSASSVSLERLSLPNLSELQVAPASAPRFALLTPVGTRVRGTPQLQWQSCPGATHYDVRITDSKDQVLDQTEGAISATQWHPEKVLPSGRALTWEVQALDAEGQGIGTPLQGRFVLLTETQESAVEQQLTAARNARARGKILAEMGLLDEARATLRTLRRDSMARAWLQELAGRGKR